MTKNEFIKIGEQIIAKPKGADYDLIPGKVYDLSWNRWEDSPIFKENGELNLPKKIYSTKTDDIFKKRIITYFNKANTNTTGVMLAGTKGTGKTVMAKILAKKLEEFDPMFIEEPVLCEVIMTCNDLSKVSQYMQDRCSRIRYLRRYSPDENAAFLPMLADDFGIKNKEEVVKFCKENIKLLSMDNIVSFMSEVKMLEDEDISLQEIINIMNISTENIPTKVSDTVEYDDEYDNEDNEYSDDDYECCDAA